MAYLLLSRDGELVVQFPLEQERVTLGRDDDCDLVLTDLAVSRLHADLSWDGQGYVLTDYSRNGTFVSGERINDCVALGAGDTIELGSYSIRYEDGKIPSAEVTVDTSYQPTLVLKYEPQKKLLTTERLHLTITTPDKQAHEYQLDRLPITMGGASQNDIIIQHDPYISRTHCAIEATPGGLIVRDCGSRNGTWWGKTQIQTHVLPERGKFQVGNTQVEYHAERIRETVEPSGQQRFGEMLGTSRAMQELFTLVTKVAPSQATVLIAGESGTGKELMARAIHAASGRANRPFVALNCGALPASIIESELFGHERGAFTGASNQHKGAFEQAEGGTLFLDEIGEMPLDLQPHLLRVLETRSVRRVGGNREIPINVRIIAATNRDLPRMVKAERFREDLFYRLCIVPITIPPLRERPADIHLLTDHFLRVLRGHRTPTQLTSAARESLLHYNWPGNARELRHTIERSLLLTQNSMIDAPDIIFHSVDERDETISGPLTRRNWENHERSTIIDMLRQHDGNISHAAKSLGIGRSTLSEKVKRYAIDVRSLRS